MKAKEILKKYDISRNTLSNWVKNGWIEVIKLPNKRYIYGEINFIKVVKNNE